MKRLLLLALVASPALSVSRADDAAARKTAEAAAKWVNERGLAFPSRGEDPLSVDSVIIRCGTKLTAAEIERLAAFPKLKSVTLDGCEFPAAALRPLRDCNRLDRSASVTPLPPTSTSRSWPNCRTCGSCGRTARRSPTPG